MSKKQRYNERQIERVTQAVPNAVTPTLRHKPAALVGLVIALAVGLLGWGIIQFVTLDQTSNLESPPADSSLPVVPANENESPSYQSGNTLQNAPNQSLDGSNASELQPVPRNDAQQQGGSELLNQVERTDLNLSITP